MLNHASKQIDEKILELTTNLCENFDSVPNNNKSNLAFHLMFVIDVSGSMQSTFSQVKKAFLELIESRKSFNKDKVTVILFDDVARLKYSAIPINSQFDLDFSGGGTDFTCAINKLADAYQLTAPN